MSRLPAEFQSKEHATETGDKATATIEPNNGKSPLTSAINWRKDLLLPMFLTLFAGLVGVAVGFTWEYIKFKRQTVYEKRISFISESRKHVSDLYVDTDTVVRSIEFVMNGRRAGACNRTDLERELDLLYSIGARVTLLPRLTGGMIDSTGMMKDVELFRKNLELYLRCLEADSCGQCRRRNYDILSPLQSILDTHTKQLYIEVSPTSWSLKELLQ
jgi:hypothetical protein